MTSPSIRAGRYLLAVSLAVGVALAIPAMMLSSASGAHGGAHGHHHQAPAGSQSDCCEFCLTSCATAPTPAGSLSLAITAMVATPPTRFPDTGRLLPTRLPHSLPPSVGPPSLHA
ncbi:MAG TPA: hypothetical protein VLT17_01500 [Gemmatimonadales bacterium]|nr:hypothetical protein [Gemmatimonadales bacterium]